MVGVVAEQAGGDIDDQMVHVGVFAGLFFAVGERADGVEGVRAFAGVPFVLHELLVIFGVNDGELAAGEGDFSEGIAEAQAAI